MLPTHVRTRYSRTGRWGRAGGLMVLAAALALWPIQPAAAQETGRLSGTVINGSSGEPLSGAQVTLEGTGMGTVTNARGQFLLLSVPAGTHTVAVRLIGYGSESVEATVDAGGTATVELELYTAAIDLEGVVATGTAGQARRREVGNSVSMITAEQIESRAIVNMTDVLQAQAPGVTIRNQGGQVGSGSTIRLRGVNTIEGGLSPLIYVDGVRLEQGSHGNPDEANTVATALDDLDPQTIERIEVVKGAAATTLYGTDAAGGVIQIFTNGGGGGEAAWTFNVEQGISNVGHVGPKEDPTGLHLNDCSMDPGCPESGTWLRNGHMQRYNLSVRGGGDELSYYVSSRWSSQEGVIASQGAEDMAFRANFTFQPFESLSIRANNMFTRRNIRWIPSGNNAEGFLLNVMRADNDYTPGHDDSRILNMKLDQMMDHFVTGANINWTPMDGMLHRVNVGLDYSTSDYTEERPWGYWAEPDGDREADFDGDRNVTIDYAGNWNTQLPVADFSSTLSWGAQYYDVFEWGVNGFGERFSGPGSKLVQSGVETTSQEDWERTASGGFFLQEQLGWNDRLFVTVGARWDGYSTFGEDFGIAMYPKVSSAYTISDHDFWPASIETTKLRFALGVSGRAPGPFASKRTWASASGDTRQPAVILSELGNPEVGPERSREMEAGFEGSALDGRLSFDFTYFTQQTYDAMVEIQLPPSVGTEQDILTNLGEVNNAGFEISANASLVRMRDLAWNVGGHYSRAENEVIRLGNVDDPRRLNRPVNAQFGDVVVNADEVGADPIFEEQYLGPAIPPTTWGVNTQLTMFRRLTLDVLGEGQSGHVHENSIGRQNVARGYWVPCQHVFDALDAEDTSGLTAGELGKCDPDQVTYGMWTDRGDFFKLRSISLNYRMPASFLPSAASGMTLRVMGRNLLTVTDYSGTDPEVSENGARSSEGNFEYYNVPPARQLVFSATVNF